jgi:hypothetical protein
LRSGGVCRSCLSGSLRYFCYRKHSTKMGVSWRHRFGESSSIQHPFSSICETKWNKTGKEEKQKKRRRIIYYVRLSLSLSLSAPYSNRLVFVIITPGRHLLLLITAF